MLTFSNSFFKSNPANQALKQTIIINKDPLLVARKKLTLKEGEASILIANERNQLSWKTRKMLLKKYLASPTQKKLTIHQDHQNTMPSFLRPYIRKIAFFSSGIQQNVRGGMFGWIVRSNYSPKTIRLVRKLKHIETFYFCKALESHLPRTFEYLPKLKNLAINLEIDGKNKMSMKPFQKRKIPRLQKLSLKITEDIYSEMSMREGFGQLHQYFYEYLSLQKDLKELNFSMQEIRGRLSALKNLLIHFFQQRNLERVRMFLPESLVELFEKPETISFLNKVEALFIMPLTSPNEEILLRERAKFILFIPVSLDVCLKSELVFERSRNIRALYLETATDPSILEKESYCFPEVSRFLLKVQNTKGNPVPNLEKFCQRIKQLESFSLIINNMNINTAQEIQKFKKIPCFNALKGFYLEATTKSTFNPSTKKYDDEVFDLNVLKALELASLKSLENLTLKFTRKNDILAPEILKEISGLEELKKLELSIPDFQRGDDPIEIDTQGLPNLKDLRITALLTKGDFESICQQVLPIKDLEIIHLTTTQSGEVAVDEKKIQDIIMASGNLEKLKEISLKDRFKNIIKSDLLPKLDQAKI